MKEEYKSENKIELTDEEALRILNEYKEQQEAKTTPEVKENNKQEEAGDDGWLMKKIFRFLEWFILETKVGDFIEYVFTIGDHWIEHYHDKICRCRLNPYVAELLYCLVYYFIIGCFFSLLIITVIGWIVSDALFVAYCCLCCAGIMVPFIFLVMHTSVLYGMDVLNRKRVIVRNVELHSIRLQITNPNFASEDYPISYMPKVYQEVALPCYFLYLPLPENHKPKSSPSKKPIRFFDDDSSTRFIGKTVKSVHFVLTERKSKLIDDLFMLEQSTEFQITYR